MFFSFRATLFETLAKVNEKLREVLFLEFLRRNAESNPLLASIEELSVQKSRVCGIPRW